MQGKRRVDSSCNCCSQKNLQDGCPGASAAHGRSGNRSISISISISRGHDLDQRFNPANIPRGRHGGHPVGVLATRNDRHCPEPRAWPFPGTTWASQGSIRRHRSIQAHHHKVMKDGRQECACMLCNVEEHQSANVEQSVCNSRSTGRFWGWTEDTSDCDSPPCVMPSNQTGDDDGFLRLNPAGRVVIPSFYLPPAQSFTLEMWISPTCNTVSLAKLRIPLSPLSPLPFPVRTFDQRRRREGGREGGRESDCLMRMCLFLCASVCLCVHGCKCDVYVSAHVHTRPKNCPLERADIRRTSLGFRV